MANIKAIPGGATTPKGFSAAAVYTAIKKRENQKPDVAILYSEQPCSCAACFTTNKFCAAPVILDREILKKGKARAVVVNSGNANAATGKQGIEDALTVEREAEKLLGLGEDEVFVSSTGVIGQEINVKAIVDAVPQLAAQLRRHRPASPRREGARGRSPLRAHPQPRQRQRSRLCHHDHRYRPQGVRL